MGHRREDSGAMAGVVFAVLAILVVVCLLGGAGVIWMLWTRAEHAKLEAERAMMQAMEQRKQAEAVAHQQLQLLRTARAVPPTDNPIAADEELAAATRVLTQVDGLWFNAEIVRILDDGRVVVALVDLQQPGDLERTVTRDQLQWPVEAGQAATTGDGCRP